MEILRPGIFPRCGTAYGPSRSVLGTEQLHRLLAALQAHHLPEHQTDPGQHPFGAVVVGRGDRDDTPKTQVPAAVRHDRGCGLAGVPLPPEPGQEGEAQVHIVEVVALV